MKIGYFINQYPKVSHSFIRREIASLEKSGLSVSRYALKSDYSELVDKKDILEYGNTNFILATSKLKMLLICFCILISTPILWLRAFFIVNRIGFKSERGLLRHYFYFLEACVLKELIKKDKIQHLHAHFGTNPAVIALLASKLASVPYSFTVHGPEEFDKPQFISLPEKIKHASFVVAISSFGKSQLYRLIKNTHWHKIKVVHCGLEPEFFSNYESKSVEENKLVCIGRLCEQKGQSLIIDALHILKKKKVDFSLRLIGDGEMRAEIEDKIQQYNLEDNIKITGWMSSEQINTEILNSKLTLLPSFAEGLPVVIMESMSLEKPVISTYIAGIPELIKNNENGWLVPAGDEKTLADTLEVVLDLDTNDIKEIGKKARTTAIERHHIDIESTKLANHIKSSINSGIV